jgi:hypothetical protein
MLVEESPAGTYTLKRIEIPVTSRKSRSAARKAVRATPLKMRMDWDALKEMTREP